MEHAHDDTKRENSGTLFPPSQRNGGLSQVVVVTEGRVCRQFGYLRFSLSSSVQRTRDLEQLSKKPKENKVQTISSPNEYKASSKS